MRKPKGSASGKTWLPLTVSRPFGPIAPHQQRVENEILAMLGDPDEVPLPELSGADYPQVRVVVGAEPIAALSATLDESISDPAEKDAVANALVLAARDPARHTVIASLSADDFGIVVFGRSIEYVAGQGALPICVRYVTEILGACRPARSGVASDIAVAAVGQVTFGLLNLCARAAQASTMLNAVIASVEVANEYDTFELPIEIHLRTTPGTDVGFAKLVADTLSSFEDFVRIVSSDEFEHLAIRSPYLPGSLFTRPDRNATGDTAAHLRGREILRSASLAGRSVAGTHGPTVLGEYGDNHYHAEEADPSKLPLYDVLMDPAEPRVSDVLDLDGTDPRVVHFEVYPCGLRGDLVLVELERTVSVEFEGDDAVILLDVSLPALVGPYDRDGMASAIAEMMMFQAKVDLESAYFEVFDRVRRFKVRFTAPVAVASALRTEIGQLHDMLDEMPPNFELVRAIVLNLSPRKPKPVLERTPLTLLDSPVDIDPADLADTLASALDRLGFAADMQMVEVLVRQADGPAYVDIEDLEPTTREPFLVLRIWFDGGQVPAVVSTLTGKVFEGDGGVFRTALERSRLPPVERAPGPSGPDRVRAIAERMFTRTSIEVAHIHLLTPLEDRGQLFCNDADAMAEYGDDIEAHLALLGDDAERPRDNVESYEHHRPQGANFHVAVADDLRVHWEHGVLAEGAAAVVASFLTQAVTNLIEVDEMSAFGTPDPDYVFLFAYAYVRQCVPDAVSDAEFEGLVETVYLGGVDPSDPEEPTLLKRTIADIVEYVGRETGDRAQAPLYLVTARIAAAFEAMSEDRGGFGLAD